MTITLSALDPQIAAKSLLKHPFYVRWSKGELTKDELKVYAKEYFHLVERIPGIVERVRDRATEKNFKAKIEENRIEEQEHVELWKRFAKSLGISEQELVSHKASAKVEQAIQSLENAAERNLESGIVTMYALEAELPAIAATKKDGLCKFYGLDSEDAQIYFDEHLKEEKHLEVWRTFNVDGVQAREMADVSLTAQNQVLDAVCEECGIGMDC